MKVVVYAIDSQDDHIIRCALEQVLLRPKHYPNWIYRFYVGRKCPDYFIKQIESMTYVDVIFVNEALDGSNHLNWQLKALFDPVVKIALFRDVQYRITTKETNAVNEWCNSNFAVHAFHEDDDVIPWMILPYAWGCNLNKLPKASIQSIKRFRQARLHKKALFAEFDLLFLKTKVYPILKSSILVHVNNTTNSDMSEPYPTRENKMKVLEKMTHTPHANQLWAFIG